MAGYRTSSMPSRRTWIRVPTVIPVISMDLPNRELISLGLSCSTNVPTGGLFNAARCVPTGGEWMIIKIGCIVQNTAYFLKVKLISFYLFSSLLSLNPSFTFFQRSTPKRTQAAAAATKRNTVPTKIIFPLVPVG